MKTLALEFSTSLRSVALVDGGSVRAAIHEQGGQQTRAFALVERVLREAGIERQEVQRLAIGLGPGSYAGIRVALSITNGWQLAVGIETLGISTARVLAESARDGGTRGEIAIVVDAQRDEFYLSRWDLSDSETEELAPLTIVTRSAVEEHLARGLRLFGPDVANALPGVAELFPDAGVLGRLGALEASLKPASSLEPIYLRPVAFVKAPPPRADL